MICKLRTRKGESITEALVSILIVSLSAAMLAMMITTAVGLNRRTAERTDRIYEELTAAETGQHPAGGTVNIGGRPVSVEYFALDGEALAAYRRAGDGG